jgi:hypothetical protein
MKKLISLVSVVALQSILNADAGHAQPAYSCHHDPVCQAKRDAGKDSKLDSCAKKSGVSGAAWRKWAVPPGPKADAMKACMAS